MSKILKNQTASPILIGDTGVSVPAFPTTYTIVPNDYPLWAASSDIVTSIGNGDIIVNDGSYDLSKAEGIGLIQGSFIRKQINFDPALIASDRLKVDILQQSPNDFLTKVSGDDQIGNYLENKIVGTPNKIELTVLNDGADEDLKINIGSDIFDKSINTTNNITEGGANLFFTNERAQDAIGNILVDSASVDLTYNDVANTISASVLPAGVDHNSLQNFVANKHIDHSTVNITAGTGLNGGGDITASRTLNIANTTVTAGSYGSATQVPNYTVNAQGQLTAAANTTIAIPSTQVTDFTEAAQDAVGNILTDTTTIDFSYNDVSNTISANVIPGAISHSTLGNLTVGDDHSQYLLLAGRAGGQTARGGVSASGNLTLSSTANATKGKILFGTSAYDETTNFLGINTSNPMSGLTLASTNTGQIRGVSNFQYSPDTNSAKFVAGKARGTIASPTAALTSDVLGNYSFFGYGTTTFTQGAAIRALAQQNITDTAAGTNIELQTAALNSTAMQTVLTIQHDQQVVAANAIRPGNSTIGTAGNIRYSGTDLEGFVNGQWFSLTKSKVYTSQAVGPNSTTSTSFQALATVTPMVAGTYLVIFTVDFATVNDGAGEIDIAIAGVSQTASVRRQAVDAVTLLGASADGRGTVTSTCIVTITVANSIDGRFRSVNNSVTANARQIIALRIS